MSDMVTAQRKTLPAVCLLALIGCFLPGPGLEARPRHRQALKKHYGDRLSKALDACTTCHLRREEVQDAVLFESKPPHNPFGVRLRILGEELKAQGKPYSIAARLRVAAGEDADGDGAPNELEILAGKAPGDPRDVPAAEELAAAAMVQRELGKGLPRHAWEPFHAVERPPVPAVKRPEWVRNPIDAFIAEEHESRGLAPRPEAPRHVLLRRVSLDLTGLAPAPEELRAFLADPSPAAYETAVDKLIASPRHGERWGRHWMDVWRYSDWAGWGNQVRDSQPHIWRWRDWIVESLNADKGYDRMVLEMLAGDEIAPGDPGLLRATGYLARSFKLLSREAWMQEAVDHAAQAFLGVTLGCARCHDHMFDPISQRDYYRVRAIFEPYQVRIDRRPGEPDIAKDGLPRAFDGSIDVKTFLFVRGDDRNPDKEHPLEPGVPDGLGGPELKIEPVPLPLSAAVPEKAEYIVRETVAAGEKAIGDAKSAFQAAVLEAARPEKAADLWVRAAVQVAEMAIPLSEAKHAALLATLRVEAIEDAGGREKDPEEWKKAATEAMTSQRWHRFLDRRRGGPAAELALARAQAAAETAAKAAAESKADKAKSEASSKAAAALAKAKEALEKAVKDLDESAIGILLPATADYAKRELKTYPSSSTGRRLAFARWVAHRQNPLAARVAVNHIWLRHFGQALVPSVADFGLNGRPPAYPALLDWLAAELMEPTVAPLGPPWSMKRIHRLIVTSSAYRMGSTPDEADAAIDPDNRYLWRMVSRRLEAEAVRDNVLHVAGRLDEAMGGPELDQVSILSTGRRSLYYRQAAEKQAEFLKVFDMAGVTECYERRSSVVPQQALALANSPLTVEKASCLARALAPACGADARAYAAALFERVLARPASPAELESSARFLEEEEKLLGELKGKLPAAADAALRARESLARVLLNHNDFVTVR